MNITYRLLHEVADLRQVVSLQRMVWGDDPDVLIAVHILHSLAANGCPVIGAFDGDLLVGFSIAFFGLDNKDSQRPAMANLKLASKRLAVHPDYRSQGIAHQLKLEQYQFAKQQGIRLVTWTFDPLISRNAYLYIHKLGTVVRTFIPDYFGDILGQIEAVHGTDRMICEWWVGSNRVEERLYGTRPPLTVKQYVAGNAPIINTIELAPQGYLFPNEGMVILGDYHIMLVEVLPDTKPLETNPALADMWRVHTRSLFGQLFGAGYIVTDFLYEAYEGRERSFYVFSYDGNV